jgi:hypothetical protein
MAYRYVRQEVYGYDYDEWMTTHSLICCHNNSEEIVLCLII